MRLLVIYLSPPETLFSSNLRMTALVRGFLELGHSVDYVVMPMKPSFTGGNDTSAIEKANIIRLGSGEKKERLENRKQNMIWKILKGMIKKVFIYDYSYFSLRKLTRDILPEQEYDVIISSSDPKTSHLAAERFLRSGLKCRKWIQYWGDPLASDITNRYLYPEFVLRRIEKNILKRADEVFYVSPVTLELQKNRYAGLSDRMKYLPVPYIREKLLEPTGNKVFTIGYFGAYYSHIRNIIPFYQACRSLKENVVLNIVGDSDLNLEETEHIHIFQRGKIDEFERKTDLFVCILNLRGGQIPGKIYHYAAANRPVLVIKDGEYADRIHHVFDRYGRYCFTGNHEAEIRDSILELMNDRSAYVPCAAFQPAAVAKRMLDGEDQND